ncbi:hypothetical protein BsWGS_17790 [Bradybaena similaris]
MDGQDDDSDKGREDEEDSDEAQAEVDRRVAQMLQNQQQYLHMCNSSAHILQLLSHLVPGMAISGQVMDLESVTEDSEEATSRSGSASSSHSPATSDDNKGCVLWAEPIMTCQLIPSWRSVCNDVRRLPPGVKPEDLKCQHPPAGRGSSISSYYSAAAAAIARNRYPSVANRSTGATLPGQTHPQATSGDANTNTSRREGDNKTPATQGSRSGRDSKQTGFDDKKSKKAESTIAKMMCTPAETRPKVPSAADALRRTRNILAAVTSGCQANNNNNPEEVSHGKGSNQDTSAARPEHGNCVKDIGGTRAGDHAAEQHMASGSAHGVAAEKGLKATHLKEQNEASTHFPAPILVRAAGVQEYAINARLGETEDCNERVNVIETRQPAGNPNNCESANTVYEICDDMSQTDEFSSQLSTIRESGQPGRIACNEKVLSGSLTTQTDDQRSRLARQSRPNRQLYRYPASTCAVAPRNRTQQSVSLGCAHTVPLNLPPPVNISHSAPTSKSADHEQLKLDFNYVNMAQNTQRSTQKHIITLEHLKNALKVARRNLQKINMRTEKENSLAKDESSHTRSTVSTFTVTEVESMNIAADHAEKDSVSSETMAPIASEMIYEGAGVVDTDTKGDASTADSITEVENIFYVQHRSQNELTNVLEVCTGREGLSGNDGEEREDDECREISSCQRQKDVTCSRCPSDTFAKREDRSELRSPIPSTYIDHAPAKPTCPQTQQLNHCHTEATCLNTEQGTVVRATHLNGDARTPGEFKQIEATERETTVPLSVDNTGEAPARHSQSNTAHWKEEIASPGSHDINVNVRLTKTKSAENSAVAEQHNFRAKSCRPYSTGERKTLEGDNDCDCILAVKIRNDFPPHFPGAGDAVENIHIVDNIKGSPYGSLQLAVISDEKQEPNAPQWNRAQQNEPDTIQAAECGRKEVTKPLRKRSFQKAGKRLLFIQTGRSNNASHERENTIGTTTSENDLLLDPTLVQPKKYEAQSILTEDSVENGFEGQAEQDTQMRVSCLGESSCNSSMKDSVKQNYFEDDDIRIHRHSYTYERSHPNDSSSTSDQSNSLVSLIVFNQSTEDASLNTTEKPADVIAVATQTTRSASDSFVRSHRRTRCASKTEHARDSVGKPDSELTQETTSDNATASGSNYTHYFDMIPGFMPSDNCHTCPKILNSSSKNILITPGVRDQPLATVECNSKAIFSAKTDKELEMAETQANFQISSEMAEKGSPDSCKNSSIQTPNFAWGATLAQAHTLSSEVNTPLASPPLHEEPINAPGGLKSRLRRFFSQCLHPLSRRN